MKFKKTFIATLAAGAALVSAPSFAHHRDWHHGHFHPHAHYVPARPVYVVPPPVYYSYPAPAYYPAPVYPAEPSLSIRLRLPL